MRAGLPAFALALAFGGALPAGAARADEPGEFDYYVLALSWSPDWCAVEGAARGSPQCDGGFGWVLHGLWPQWEEGWPSYCRAAFADPSRRQTAAMADIMGTAGLAWHAWDKHGSCSGLSPEGYFALAREAFAGVAIPPEFGRLREAVRIEPAVVEAAFLAADPRLQPDMVTVTCREGYVEEVRLCLTRDLLPRACAADARRDCRAEARMEPVR